MRGRALLAARLARPGLALTSGALAAVLVQEAPAAPPALMASTIQAATLLAAAPAAAAGVISPAVAHLTEGVIRSMFLGKLRLLPVALTALALVLSLAAPDSPTWAQPGAGKLAGPSASGGTTAGKKPGWRVALTLKHEHPIALVACGADWSAAADEGGNLFLWKTRTGKGRKLVFKGGKGQGLNPSVERLQLTSDGNFLFAVVWGHRALFRVNLLKPDHSPGLGGKHTVYLGVSADGETWLERYNAGQTLTLRPNQWTHRNGAVDYETVKYEARVTHAVLSPDDRLLAAVTADGNLHVHERTSLRETQTLLVPKEMVTDVQFSPDGKRLAVVAQDSSAKVYDTESGKEVGTLKGHRGIVFTVAFSPDGKTVVTGGDDNTARLWDAATGRPLAVLEGHTDSVRSVAFAPDGRTLLTGSADRTVKVWRPAR
jgi:WD40 repeat protein